MDAPRWGNQPTEVRYTWERVITTVVRWRELKVRRSKFRRGPRFMTLPPVCLTVSKPIPGAPNSPTYVLTESDIGKGVRCTVTATNNVLAEWDHTVLNCPATKKA